MSKPLPHGVIAPILTPFQRDLSIDRPRYVDFARHLLARGCIGLAPFGTTGEALSVGVEERMGVLNALANERIDPGRLIPGTGLANLPETVRLTRHAMDVGCAGAMVLPPFYYKDVSPDGLFAYFAALVEKVATPSLRIYLYHIPQVAGVGIPVAVVKRLKAEFGETIAGIKDSSGDWSNTAALLEIDDLIVYPGSELVLLKAMALGAPGCITATANINARAIVEVIGLIDAGNTSAAEDRMSKVTAIRMLMQEFGQIAAQKQLLAMATGHADWGIVRPPLETTPRARAKELADRLKSENDFAVEAA